MRDGMKELERLIVFEGLLKYPLTWLTEAKSYIVMICNTETDSWMALFLERKKL